MGTIFGGAVEKPVEQPKLDGVVLPEVASWTNQYEVVRDDYKPKILYRVPPLNKFYNTTIDNFRIFGNAVDHAINGRRPVCSYVVLYLDMENNKFYANLKHSNRHDEFKVLHFSSKGSFKYLIDSTESKEGNNRDVKKKIKMIYEEYSVNIPGEIKYGHDEYSESTEIPPVIYSGKVKTEVKKIQDYDDSSNLNVIFFRSANPREVLESQFEYCVYKPPMTEERKKELKNEQHEAYRLNQQYQVKKLEEKLKMEKEKLSKM